MPNCPPLLTARIFSPINLERLATRKSARTHRRDRSMGDCRRSGCSDEIEAVAAFYAQELAVDAGVVAIVAANDFVVADAQSGAAAVGAMRADGADVVHFPGPRLVSIHPAGERAHGADVDAGSAFVAFQMIVMIGNDSAITPRLATPSAFTPIPSSQTRTQR